MAETVVIGTVLGVKISRSSTADNAKVFVRDEATELSETFQLWDDSDAEIPDRVTQSMWVSLCRDAVVNGKRVLVVPASSNSAQVVSIELRP